ncbi:MAG TPA: 4a-hydroxytetrahydrobiopterin dehydratase [Kiritimatiellia bacterium]|nr:4a-hydroxytetrahydrobiopterin dehydratase [Kiritimatiellia bacterium]
MNEMESNLVKKQCKPCESGTKPLSDESVCEMLMRIPAWARDGKQISRVFTFKNYYQTVSFVNAVAWLAHREDHHPDITFGYKVCTIRYSTHSVGGLTENDFICAAKIDALLE